MDFFRYDFDYAWPWTYGHLIAAIACGGLAWLCRARRLPRWTTLALSLVALWAIGGWIVVNGVLRFSLPVALPTPRFLAEGSGRVLDMGAGSGRSTLMVLLERPNARVVALDRYQGYYGIVDNTPARLLANARAAGAETRVEAVVGDMRDMPFPDAAFDAVVSVAAIDHLNAEGIKLALTETGRVLRPRGEFLLMVINPDRWVQFALPFLHAHGYFGGPGRTDWWRTQLVAAGFTVVEEGTPPATRYFLVRKGESRLQTPAPIPR